MTLSKKNRNNIFMGFATLFLDVFNYSLIVPILPYLCDDLNATEMQQGILFSSYSLMQLISLLIMGPMSDIYGRKPFLILSLFGSCFGSLLQGISNSMWTLILFRALTGLFAGSLILVQALVADLTTADDRNPWLARLDSINSAAFIIGPAFGGVLSSVNNHFPFIVAGVVSGIALILAFFFLHESNKSAIELTDLNNQLKTASAEDKPTIQAKLDAKRHKTSKKEKKEKVKISPLIFLCFIFEFCNRWAVNAFDSRYGSYLADMFGTTKQIFSIVICAMSLLTFVESGFIYPYLVASVRIPIPYLAFTGVIIEICGYCVMIFVMNQWWNIIGSVILWVGYCLASTMAVSIISNTQNPSIQGQVLSYNNMFAQVALIVSPTLLSAVYERSKQGCWVFCVGVSFIGLCAVSRMCCYPRARDFGRVAMYDEPGAKDVEMATMEKKEEGSNDSCEKVEENTKDTEQALPKSTPPVV